MGCATDVPGSCNHPHSMLYRVGGGGSAPEDDFIPVEPYRPWYGENGLPLCHMADPVNDDGIDNY